MDIFPGVNGQKLERYAESMVAHADPQAWKLRSATQCAGGGSAAGLRRTARA